MGTHGQRVGDESSGGLPRGARVFGLLRQAAWVGGGSGWSAGRLPGGRLDTRLFGGKPAPLLQHSGSDEKRQSMVLRHLL